MHSKYLLAALGKEGAAYRTCLPSLAGDTAMLVCLGGFQCENSINTPYNMSIAHSYLWLHVGTESRGCLAVQHTYAVLTYNSYKWHTSAAQDQEACSRYTRAAFHSGRDCGEVYRFCCCMVLRSSNSFHVQRVSP